MARPNTRDSIRAVVLALTLLFVLCPLRIATAAEPSAQPPAQPPAQPNDNAGFEQRLEQLELRQEELVRQFTGGKGQVKTFLGNQISLGGFFENAVTGIWGSDTTTQFSTNENILALNLTADFSDKVRFSSQTLTALEVPILNADNNPNAVALGLPSSAKFGSPIFAAILPQAYFEYSSDPSLSIQTGLGYVPFGIAFQQRDLVLFRRRQGPQMLTASGGDGVVIASPVWSGIHVSGVLNLDKNRWGYDFYTLTPASNTKTMGAGGRVWLDLARDITAGFSTQTAKRDGDTYEALGTDLKLKLGQFGTDTEYAINIASSEPTNAWSFYVEPYYQLFGGKFLVYGTADYLDNPIGQTSGLSGITGASFSSISIPDPFQKWELGGGVNWLPYPFTRFRLGILLNDYVGDNANPLGTTRTFCSLDLSAGVEF